MRHSSVSWYLLAKEWPRAPNKKDNEVHVSDRLPTSCAYTWARRSRNAICRINCQGEMINENTFDKNDSEGWLILNILGNIPWWRHEMEMFSTLLALCEGNHQPPVDSPHKSQWRGVLMFSLICAWTNGWAITRDAGDLRRHRTHYDVTVMAAIVCLPKCQWSESWRIWINT